MKRYLATLALFGCSAAIQPAQKPAPLLPPIHHASWVCNGRDVTVFLVTDDVVITGNSVIYGMIPTLSSEIQFTCHRRVLLDR